MILTSSAMLMALIAISGDVSLSETSGWDQTLSLGLSIPALVAGVGLLQLRSWGRAFGLVISVALLPLAPFGTLTGAYGLWVLIPQSAAALFQQAPEAPGAGQTETDRLIAKLVEEADGSSADSRDIRIPS